MYSFNGFCKVVIRYAAINAWRDRNRRRQKEISFEYLTEEKFYPLSTSDEFLKSPYEQYPVTICGQTIILTNGELAAALLSLPEKKRKSFIYTFSRITHSRKSGIYTGIARVRHGITLHTQRVTFAIFISPCYILLFISQFGYVYTILSLDFNNSYTDE